MYSLRLNSFGHKVVDRIDDEITMTGFGMHPGNSDYERFKIDIVNGVELKDIEGNIMTEDAIRTLLEELP